MTRSSRTTTARSILMNTLPVLLLLTSVRSFGFSGDTSSCWVRRRNRWDEILHINSRRSQYRYPTSASYITTRLFATSASDDDDIDDNENDTQQMGTNGTDDILRRQVQLERLVAKQAVVLSKMQSRISELTDIVNKFSTIVELLETAGLSINDEDEIQIELPSDYEKVREDDDDDDIENVPQMQRSWLDYEYSETEIFGTAPTSVTEAADSAGAAILAAMLAGKLRMLVDVRDAELSRDPDLLVQFIELAILPVAAGLEGLDSERNRVKVIFPTVSQLLQYRKSMALSAPEVVALSTLGFDCVEDKDNLVVLIAPSPDDEDGLKFMKKLLQPDDPEKQLRQPFVVLNYHMCPVTGLPSTFEVAYHLRLLNVSYISGEGTSRISQKENATAGTPSEIYDENEDKQGQKAESSAVGVIDPDVVQAEDADLDDSKEQSEDAALEAAMAHASDLAHAHDQGVHQGVTRAMVIRAYPRPWHVFVDLAPDADVDFEVAATFDVEPTVEDVHQSIVECIEGSELEEELVAQQMQAALESGQLEKVNEMLEFGNIDDVQGNNDEDDDFDNTDDKQTK